MNRVLEVSQEATPEIKNLLLHNLIGTPGKSMVYQHQRVAEKLAHLPKPIFVSLKRRGGIQGTCCFCKRQILANTHGQSAFYIRYFTFRAGLRSGGMTRKTGYGVLHRAVAELLEKSPEPQGNAAYFAFVDKQNVRSLQLTGHFGFRVVGKFRTVFFSRQQPKNVPQLEVLKVHDQAAVQALIQKQYNEHQLFHTENLFHHDGMLVWREQGQIVAGGQFFPERWYIHSLPGKIANWLLHRLSGVPWLRGLFGTDFQFLSAEALFSLPGHEDKLERLLEGALHHYQRKTAILCLDERDPVYKEMKQINRGWIRFLAPEKEMLAVARGISVDATKPIYVSPFDVM